MHFQAADMRQQVATIKDLTVIEDCYNNLYIADTTLNELCEILFTEDFGIDEDFDEEDIEDYESDEEFTQRIADIM